MTISLKGKGTDILVFFALVSATLLNLYPFAPSGGWHYPGPFAIYWTLLAILLIDRLTVKKINNIVFWKTIFVTGILVLIIKDLKLFSIFFNARFINIKDMLITLMYLLIPNIITGLCIGRSYQMIKKGY